MSKNSQGILMRCTSLLCLLLISPLMPPSASAASLIFTNVGAELELDEDMPVRFRPNEVIVTCAGECRPKPRIETFAFTASTVSPGTNNASLSWDSPGAEVCLGETPTGIAGWSGTAIEKSGTMTLTVPASAAPYSFTIRCFAMYGSQTASTTLTVR